MSGIGHGQALKRKIALAAPLLTPVTTAFWQHEHLARLFPEFLVAIHGSVRATVPLMEAALDEAGRRESADAVCAGLCRYLPAHIAEERDHDDWLLSDLEHVGYSRQAVLDRVPHPAIAGMVGAQYYWIKHAHPVALLGFFAVLEGNPPVAEDLREIQRRTRLPDEAFRMLHDHAALDEQHAAELFAVLDGLPLTRVATELIGTSALHTIAMLRTFFDALLTRAPAPLAIS